MKKIIIILSIVFLLTGCFGSKLTCTKTDENKKEEYLFKFKDNKVSSSKLVIDTNSKEYADVLCSTSRYNDKLKVVCDENKVTINEDNIDQYSSYYNATKENLTKIMQEQGYNCN